MDIYGAPDQDSQAFGVLCSSFVTFSSERKDPSAPSLNSICATLSPFTGDEFPEGGPSPLSLCLKCGAYPHSRNERELGSWKCSFCGMRNTDGIYNPPPPCISPIEAIEYIERTPCFEPITSNEDRIVHIFAIDAVLFRDNNPQSILLSSLSQLTNGAKVALIIVDEQLRILRIGQQTLLPLMIDVVPFTGSNLSKYVKSLVQSNQYLCPVEFLQANFEPVFESLCSTFSSSATPTLPRSILFCLNSLVNVCSQLTDNTGTTCISAKCVLIMGREFRIIDHGLDSRQVRCSRYADLGKKAYSSRCTFYALQLGISALNVAGIDAFVSATGGFVISAETLKGSCFGDVLHQILGKASMNILPTDLATIEFRSTKCMEIERVTGPVIPIEDVIATSKVHQKEFVEDALFLNEKHFAAAFQASENSTTVSQATSVSGDLKKKYRKLASSIKNSIPVCGLFPREDLETSVAFQIRRVDASNDGKSNSFWSRLKKYPAKLLQVDSSRLGNNAPSSTILSEEDFVQVVVRFSYRSVDSLRRLEKVSVTRVWTMQFNPSEDKTAVLQNLNVPLWCFGIMRGVVADFHDQTEECFDGPRPHRSIEADYNKHKALKRKYEQQLDAWYKDVALEWKSDHSKVVHTARYFYHCLEGPLMDGPSASPQEAYILRSMFLRSSWGLSRKILLPVLRLDINFYPLGRRREQIVSLKSMPPDSTSLVPFTITLLDIGDKIIIRRNISTLEENCDFSGDEAIDGLISFARDLAKNRFPAACVTILNQPGGPLDRMLLSRLSPSHLDAKENIVRRLQVFEFCKEISVDDILSSVKNMPVTDQIYFQQFLALKSGFVREEPHSSSGKISIPLHNPSSAPPLSSTISAIDRGFSATIVDSNNIV